MSEKKFTTSEMRSHVRAPNRSMTWDDTCTNMIRWAADLIDAAEEVVKENAAQALLIANLKGDCEAGKRLLREQMALTTARTGEALFVAQQLSDTQRQNSELMQRVAGNECTWTEADSERMPGTYEGTCGIMWTFTEGGINENKCLFCPRCGGRIVAASKVSNEGDGKD